MHSASTFEVRIYYGVPVGPLPTDATIGLDGGPQKDMMDHMRTKGTARRIIALTVFQAYFPTTYHQRPR